MFSSKIDSHLTSIGRILRVLVLINVINETLLRRTITSQWESRNISPFNQQAGYPWARHSLELSQFLTFSFMTRRFLYSCKIFKYSCIQLWQEGFHFRQKKRVYVPKKKILFYLHFYIHYLYKIIIIILL